MSSISATNPVSSHAYVQSSKPALVAPSQPAPAQVKPVSSDSDGDNDGSKGGKIDTHA
jgi:hypothetical protein